MIRRSNAYGAGSAKSITSSCAAHAVLANSFLRHLRAKRRDGGTTEHFAFSLRIVEALQCVYHVAPSFFFLCLGHLTSGPDRAGIDDALPIVV